MKRRDREYTDEFRAEAVTKLISKGWPETVGALTAAAKEVGVPHVTLARWAKGQQNPPPVEVVQEKRLELSQLFEDEIRAAFGVVKDKRESASYRDLMIGIGIATEKMQLLRGEPTERMGFAVTTEDIAQSQSRIEQWREERQQHKQLMTTQPTTSKSNSSPALTM